MWPEVVVHCITATVLPENATDKTVTWETSDPAIATVEGGEVVAHEEGEVTIYGGKFAFNPATTAGYMGRSKITIPAGYSVKENTDSDKDNYPYIVTGD